MKAGHAVRWNGAWGKTIKKALSRPRAVCLPPRETGCVGNAAFPASDVLGHERSLAATVLHLTGAAPRQLGAAACSQANCASRRAARPSRNGFYGPAGGCVQLCSLLPGEPMLMRGNSHLCRCHSSFGPCWLCVGLSLFRFCVASHGYMSSRDSTSLLNSCE